MFHSQRASSIFLKSLPGVTSPGWSSLGGIVRLTVTEVLSAPACPRWSRGVFSYITDHIIQNKPSTGHADKSCSPSGVKGPGSTVLGFRVLGVLTTVPWRCL